MPTFVLNTDAECFLESAREFLHVARRGQQPQAGVAQYLNDAVVVDVGSTSTSIIPIVNGRIQKGRLTLINSFAVSLFIRFANKCCNNRSLDSYQSAYASVSSELFALSGDVHLVLGNI